MTRRAVDVRYSCSNFTEDNTYKTRRMSGHKDFTFPLRSRRSALGLDKFIILIKHCH